GRRRVNKWVPSVLTSGKIIWLNRAIHTALASALEAFRPTFNPKVAGSIPPRPIRFAGLLSDPVACARKNTRTRVLRAPLPGFSKSQFHCRQLRFVAVRFSLCNGIFGPL